MFIIRSGNGYVSNKDTLQMIGGSGVAMQAQRMDEDDADDVMKRMEAKGLDCDLVTVRIGRYQH